MMMVVIRDNRDTRLGHFSKGEVVDMADHVAARWIKRKAVSKHTPKRAKPKPKPKPKPQAAPAVEGGGGE